MNEVKRRCKVMGRNISITWPKNRIKLGYSNEKNKTERSRTILHSADMHADIYWDFFV